MKRLIIDSNGLCYRAMFAMSSANLSNEEQRTEIIFNFLVTVIALAQKFETNQFIFCWDSKKNYRKEVDPDYKNQRSKNLTVEEQFTRELGFQQFTDLRRAVLKLMGFQNNFIQTGMEADDLIAKITKTYPNNKFVIISTDQDLYQLLTPNVSMYSLQSKVLTTEKYFTEKYGIVPSLWSEVKAIGGCKSDNVQGVEGVGEVTAIKFITKQLKPGVKFKRIVSDDGKNLIKFNRPLVTLPYCGTAPIELYTDRLTKKNFLYTFTKYQFTSFYQGINFSQWMEAFDLK